MSDPKTPMVIKRPLIMMFETDDGNIQCNIHRTPDMTYEHYGLLICDLVRHIANAHGVSESTGWERIEREREHPTTEIRRPS